MVIFEFRGFGLLVIFVIILLRALYNTFIAILTIHAIITNQHHNSTLLFVGFHF
jgi:hypothetical protein